MGRPHKNVVDHVAPAFRWLLSELTVAGEVNTRVAEAFQDETFPGPRSGVARQVQLVLTKSDKCRQIVQPVPAVCWFAGEAACQDGQAWTSGLLFLFAAGHFRRFAYVLAATNENVVPRHRKAAWVAAMRGACNPVLPLTPEQYAADLRAKGVSDISARLAMKDFKQRGSVPDRADRRTVTLSREERAALRDAFASGSAKIAPQLAVLLTTCQFAETADGGIAVQRDIATTPLWHFFASNGPGW